MQKDVIFNKSNMRVVSLEHFGQRVDDGGIGAAFDVRIDIQCQADCLRSMMNSKQPADFRITPIDQEQIELIELQKRFDRALGQVDAVTSEEGDCDFVHAEALANSPSNSSWSKSSCITAP